MAGQSIMQGFAHFRIPVWVCRGITMIHIRHRPAFQYRGRDRHQPGGAELPSAVVADRARRVVFSPRGDGNLCGQQRERMRGMPVVFLVLNVILIQQARL